MQVLSYTHEGLVLLLKELGVKLTKPTLKLLAWIMVALLEKTAAHLVKLAEKLPDDQTTDMARRQRIRRFLSNRLISPTHFVPLFVALLRPLFEPLDTLELIIDRTEWVKRGQPVNILSVALYYRGRAIPLFWIVKNRRGGSSLEDWKTVFTPAIEALRGASWTNGKEIHVIADREFASPKLSQWLWETFRIDSTIRLKRSEYINNEIESSQVSKYLHRLHQGQRRFLRDCTITKSSEFVMNVALLWEKGYIEPWVVMTTARYFVETVEIYSKRFGIEPMHKDWKTNAFDIESTRVTEKKRISTLLIPMALCYHLSVLEGSRKEDAGETIAAHKHKRTTGLFLVGLSAFTRLLRTAKIDRIQQFFYQLFNGHLWPEKLEILHIQKC